MQSSSGPGPTPPPVLNLASSPFPPNFDKVQVVKFDDSDGKTYIEGKVKWGGVDYTIVYKNPKKMNQQEALDALNQRIAHIYLLQVRYLYKGVSKVVWRPVNDSVIQYFDKKEEHKGQESRVIKKMNWGILNNEIVDKKQAKFITVETAFKSADDNLRRLEVELSKNPQDQAAQANVANARKAYEIANKAFEKNKERRERIAKGAYPIADYLAKNNKLKPKAGVTEEEAAILPPPNQQQQQQQQPPPVNQQQQQQQQQQPPPIKSPLPPPITPPPGKQPPPNADDMFNFT